MTKIFYCAVQYLGGAERIDRFGKIEYTSAIPSDIYNWTVKAFCDTVK